MRHLLACGAALALVSCGGGKGAAAGAHAPVTRTATIDASQFAPGVLTVALGDTVVWMNNDFFSHTVTSQAGGFDSGEIKPGQSWTYTSSHAGDFPIICTYHPAMKGTLRVK